MTGMGLVADSHLRRSAAFLLVPSRFRIRPARAAAQGRAAALDAIHQAAALGMAAVPPSTTTVGLPRAPCAAGSPPWPSWTPVTPDAARHGYLSGVYSAPPPGPRTSGWCAHRARATGRQARSMLFGLWDSERNVRGPAVSAAMDWWRVLSRIKAVPGPAPTPHLLGGYTLDNRLRLGSTGPFTGNKLGRCARPWAEARLPADRHPDGVLMALQ